MKGTEKRKKSAESSKKQKPSEEQMKKDSELNRKEGIRSFAMKRKELLEIYLRSRSRLQMRPRGLG
jgi:hypothetical protein